MSVQRTGITSHWKDLVKVFLHMSDEPAAPARPAGRGYPTACVFWKLKAKPRARATPVPGVRESEACPSLARPIFSTAYSR